LTGSVLERAYGRLGPAYLGRALFLQQQQLYPVILLMVGGLSAYVEMSLGEFVRLGLLACALQLLYSLLSVPVNRRLIRPVLEWQTGSRSDEATLAAWQAAASLPSEILRRGLFAPPLGLVLLGLYLVWSVYFVWELELPGYSALLFWAGAVILIMYAAALRFLGIERVVRPVLREIAAALPDAASPRAPGLSVRARLLVALPAINVITAVVADALTRGGDADLTDLAIVVLIATAAAASISLVLTLLLANSISEPLAELREATQRVGQGDFNIRVPVVTTDETGELARSFNEMAAGLAERDRIRKIFGTYVDPEVADYILRQGPSLQGEQIEVTVMFIDVRGFTSYAERSDPDEVVAQLNRLFAAIVPVIDECGGHVDKFVGDGLLAVFGAPIRRDDHADRAVAAALKIAHTTSELDSPLQIGIGLNSGPVVAGNIGAPERLEFSVIGDPVNVAARIEAATRTTGDTILIAEPTRALLRNSDVALDKRPGLTLKGKEQPLDLYAVGPGS
jgi:adenylate cyclase